MEETKRLEKFIASHIMGIKIISNIQTQTINNELRKIYQRIIQDFSSYELKLKSAISDQLLQKEVDLTCLQKLAISIQKMKLKRNDDYELLLFAVEGIEMGIVGVLKFLHSYENIDHDFLETIEELYQNYENHFYLLLNKAKKMKGLGVNKGQ